MKTVKVSISPDNNTSEMHKVLPILSCLQPSKWYISPTYAKTIHNNTYLRG